jgi:hypothetical protein
VPSGAAAMTNQILCDVYLVDVTVSAKAEWNENKHIGSLLDHAR